MHSLSPHLLCNRIGLLITRGKAGRPAWASGSTPTRLFSGWHNASLHIEASRSHLDVMKRCHRMRRRGWQTKHLGEASEIPMSSTRHFHAYDERWMSPSSALAYRAAVAVTTGGSSFLIRTKKTQRHLLGHLGALSGWLHTSRHIAASASSS